MRREEWVRQTILDTRQYHDPANVFHFTHDAQELALVMNDVLGAMTKRALKADKRPNARKKINRIKTLAGISLLRQKEIKEDESRSPVLIDDEEEEEEEIEPRRAEDRVAALHGSGSCDHRPITSSYPHSCQARIRSIRFARTASAYGTRYRSSERLPLQHRKAQSDYASAG